VKVNNVLAGIVVADVDTAADWYTRLFGRGPDAHPMPGLVEWHFPAASCSSSPRPSALGPPCSPSMSAT
jgi:hypothetical protein